MGIIGSIAVPALISRYHIEDYQKYTFQELMNKGYGDSDVLFKVINEKDEAFNYFKYDLQLVEANVQENSYLDGKDVNGLSFEVSGYKDDTYFGMNMIKMVKLSVKNCSLLIVQTKVLGKH